MTSQAFEDFVVGQRFTGGPRLVTEDDLRSFGGISAIGSRRSADAAAARKGQPEPMALPAPFGLAFSLALCWKLGLVQDAARDLVDTSCRYLEPRAGTAPCDRIAPRTNETRP